MRIKNLQMKRALHTALIVLLLSAAGMTKGYAQYYSNILIGDLLYDLNNDTQTNTQTAKVIGHKNGENATGGLTIPSFVTYTHKLSLYGQVYDSITRTYVVTEITGRDRYGSGDNHWYWQGAFENCNGLTGNLIIPNSVTCIGSEAFRGCSGFTGDLEFV